MDPMISLSYVAIILLAGVLCLFLAKELKVPYTLLLLLLGLFLGSVFYSGTPVFSLSSSFIVGVSTLALIFLVFDSTSRLRLDDPQHDALPSIRLINLFSLLSLLLVGLFTLLYFYGRTGLASIFYAFLLAILVVETDFGAVMVLFRDFAQKRARHVLHFLETEASFNTAVVVILPFIVISLLRNVNLDSDNLLLGILSHVPEFLYEIIIAFGVGIIVGLIMLQIMRDWYSHHWTPIVLVTSSLVAYVFTSLLGGNGVVAVAIMGFFYGNTYVYGREQLAEFSRTLSSSLEILVFVLVGMAIKLPISLGFVVDSFLLFAFVTLIRVLAVFISLQNDPFTVREKLFIGLNMPKGFALATVLLVLSGYAVPGLQMALQLVLMVMIYSLVASFLMDFYAKRILHEEVRASASGLNVLELALEESLVVRKKSGKARVSRSKKKTGAKSAKRAGKKPVKSAPVPVPKKKVLASKASAKKKARVSAKKQIKRKKR